MILTWILVSLVLVQTSVSSQKKGHWKRNKKLRGPVVELPDWMNIDLNKLSLDKLAVLNNVTDLTDLVRFFELDFKNAAKLLGPLQAKDGASNSEPCSENEFMCKDQSCIPLSQRCDGIEQCPKSSDETDCPKDLCLENQFQCNDGTCIGNSWRCDNVPDCLDASDEHGCSCGPTDFRCGDGMCIPQSERCDQTNDCTDASDEYNCRICEPNDFYCDDGACILGQLRCDREPNCNDGSDELHCDNVKPQACRGRDFTCGDGSCIDAYWQCNGYSDCADGSDELGCTPPAPFPKLTTQSPEPCPPDDWLCDDNTCIPATLRCNGRYDCPDATDELDCASQCGSTEFKCNSGECITKLVRCDGQPDCLDRSDEDNCPRHPGPEHTCSNSEHTCSNGQCVSVYAHCDGRPDCSDGSDERGCPPSEQECAPWEWNCDDGQCIDSSYRCDGDFDCRDRSDEIDCPRPGLPSSPFEQPLPQSPQHDEGWCHYIDPNKCKSDSLKNLCPKMCGTLSDVTTNATNNTAKPIEKIDEMAIFARCSPEMVTLELPVRKKSRYLPSCVRLKRCGGCCNSELLECQPTKVEVISLNVLKISKCKSRGSRVRCRQPNGTTGRVVSLSQENHVDCTCKCKEKKKDCDPLLHNYNKDVCSCVCKNEVKQRKCEKSSRLHYWDKNTCSCICKKVKECSTGELFSQDMCRCVSALNPAIGGA